MPHIDAKVQENSTIPITSTNDLNCNVFFYVISFSEESRGSDMWYEHNKFRKKR